MSLVPLIFQCPHRFFFLLPLSCFYRCKHLQEMKVVDHCYHSFQKSKMMLSSCSLVNLSFDYLPREGKGIKFIRFWDCFWRRSTRDLPKRVLDLQSCEKSTSPKGLQFNLTHKSSSFSAQKGREGVYCCLLYKK